MSCKISGCNGQVFNVSFGLCSYHFNNPVKEKEKQPILVVDETPKPQKYSPAPELKGGTVVLAGMCSICKKKPRAKWSDSYCRGCYAAWKKERRKLSRENPD